MQTLNEQEKILNEFKGNIKEIIESNFNYQESVYQFNSLLNNAKNLIDNNLSEKIVINFIKKMDNFITIKNLINEEISKLENNLKKLDINYIIYINKLVDNLKDYSLAQRNIYPTIKNKTAIKSLDTLLVNYYNKNKDIFKSIKQIHRNDNNKIIMNNNIKLNNKSNIINYIPKFKFVMNSYIKSKSLKKLKYKIKNSKSKEYLLENTNINFNNLFNSKIGIFIKKKLQKRNKSSSSPCLYKKSYIKNNKSFSFSLKEMNEIKENNKILEKKISDLIKGEKEQKKNEVNDLLGNYNKLYEIYKLINEDKIINDMNKEEFLIEKKNLNDLNKKKINEFIDNLYEKILEIIEIKQNIFKENKIDNDYNSLNTNNNIKQNYNNNYIEIILNKLKNINEYLNNNKLNEKSKNDGINIIAENKNLLSLSDELETPKSEKKNFENSKNLEENCDINFKNIIELLDINDKLIRERYEYFSLIDKEYISDKNISEKIDTNLIDNNINNNIVTYSNNISFRNDK